MIFAGLDSEEYFSRKGMGDLEESYKQMLVIDEYLNKLYDSDKIAGFQYRVIKSIEDVYDEDLDIDIVNKSNDLTFPFIWINITYKPELLQKSELLVIEESLDLRVL